MRSAIALGLGTTLLTSAGIVVAQGERFPMEPIADRSALCSMDGPSGPCVVVGRAQVGAFRIEVVRPRDHGTYLGDDTMEWNLYVEGGIGRWGTVQPLHAEATVCNGEGYERMGGYDSFELRDLRAMDLAGDRRPELVARWRNDSHLPLLVMICALDATGPRCTYPVPSGRIARDPGGIRVGDQVIPAP